MPADMPKRRLILLIPVFLAVLLLIMLFRPWKILEGDMRRISLKDPEKVDRIVLMDPFYTTELDKRDSTWYLFGTEQVNTVTVDNLLYAAGRLEVGSITDLQVFEEAGSPEEGIRELAFYRGDRLLYSFRMLRHASRYLMHPGGSDKAFYVSLPGYPDLDLERVFSAAPDHYREHLLIDLRPSDIASIGIELASGEAFGFTRDGEGNIVCRVAGDPDPVPRAATNELAVKLLFSYFTSIRYEQRTVIRADSLLGGEVFHQRMAAVEVESFSGEHHLLQIFPYRVNPGSDPHLFEALVLHNQEQEALIINYIYLDVLMRGLSHYIGEK